MTLIYGLVTGILFGIFLQKGRVLRYDKQLGALRLLDMTIIRFMLTAIMVGMVGIHLCHDLGLIKLSVKATSVGANLMGGLIFGAGWALLGYCPGTMIGAIGEGRWDGIWGVLGMLAGGMAYAEAYPAMKKTLIAWGDYGKITVPQILEVNHWFIIAAIILLGMALFRWLDTLDV